MSSYTSRLAKMTRPGLLIRAARHRTVEFNRDRALRRMLPDTHVPAPGQAFDLLAEREETMNRARTEGGAAYSPARHVELLAALMHEAQIAQLRLVA
ncbi:MAG: DUF6477 family protein [Paracoccaceae bacterium]